MDSDHSYPQQTGESFVSGFGNDASASSNNSGSSIASSDSCYCSSCCELPPKTRWSSSMGPGSFRNTNYNDDSNRNGSNSEHYSIRDDAANNECTLSIGFPLNSDPAQKQYDFSTTKAEDPSSRCQTNAPLNMALPPCSPSSHHLILNEMMVRNETALLRLEGSLEEHRRVLAQNFYKEHHRIVSLKLLENMQPTCLLSSKQANNYDPEIMTTTVEEQSRDRENDTSCNEDHAIRHKHEHAGEPRKIEDGTRCNVQPTNKKSSLENDAINDGNFTSDGLPISNSYRCSTDSVKLIMRTPSQEKVLELKSDVFSTSGAVPRYIQKARDTLYDNYLKSFSQQDRGIVSEKDAHTTAFSATPSVPSDQCALPRSNDENATLKRRVNDSNLREHHCLPATIEIPYKKKRVKFTMSACGRCPSVSTDQCICAAGLKRRANDLHKQHCLPLTIDVPHTEKRVELTMSAGVSLVESEPRAKLYHNYLQSLSQHKKGNTLKSEICHSASTERRIFLGGDDNTNQEHGGNGSVREEYCHSISDDAPRKKKMTELSNPTTNVSMANNDHRHYQSAKVALRYSFVQASNLQHRDAASTAVSVSTASSMDTTKKMQTLPKLDTGGPSACNTASA